MLLLFWRKPAPPVTPPNAVDDGAYVQAGWARRWRDEEAKRRATAVQTRWQDDDEALLLALIQ